MKEKIKENEDNYYPKKLKKWKNEKLEQFYNVKYVGYDYWDDL